MTVGPVRFRRSPLANNQIPNNLRKRELEMASILIAMILFVSGISEAIVETIVTPTPGLGHGRVADIIALVLWGYSIIHH